MERKHFGAAATAVAPPRRRARTLAVATRRPLPSSPPTRISRLGLLAIAALVAVMLPVAAGAAESPANEGSPVDPIASVAAHLDSYDSSQLAGYWRDSQVGSDAIVVAATRDAAGVQRDLRTKFPDVDVKVVAARFSRSELAGWVDELMIRAEQRPEETIAVWIDEPGNRVMVATEDGSTFPAEARSVTPDAALAVTSGLAITPVARSNAGPPMRGGLEVFGPADEVGYVIRCSAGLNAYWDEQISPLVPEKIRHYYLLSAGHCAEEGDSFTHLGGWTSIVDDSRDSGRVDALIAEHRNPADRSNKIYLTDTTSRTITAWQRYNQDAVNDVICLSGITNGNDCGTLIDRAFNFTVGGTSYRDFRRTDTQLVCDHGDSGGSIYRPFGSNATIAGMASKKMLINGSYAGCLYTHVDYVRQAFGVAPLVTAN